MLLCFAGIVMDSVAVTSLHLCLVPRDAETKTTSVYTGNTTAGESYTVLVILHLMCIKTIYSFFYIVFLVREQIDSMTLKFHLIHTTVETVI